MGKQRSRAGPPTVVAADDAARAAPPAPHAPLATPPVPLATPHPTLAAPTAAAAADTVPERSSAPMLLTVLPGFGRAFVAARDVLAGEVLLTERALVAVTHPLWMVRSTWREPEPRAVCVACCALPACLRATSDPAPCPRGCDTMYCSERCRDADATVHARVCDRELLASPLALAARFLAGGGRPWPGIEAPDRPLRRLGPDVLRLLSARLLPRFAELPACDVLRVCAAIGDAECPMRTVVCMRTYASAFFRRASYLNHSCDPNAYRFFRGAEAVVRAARDIPRGEQVCVAYLPLLEYRSPEERASSLAPLLGGPCACGRCADEARRDLEHRLVVRAMGPRGITAEDLHRVDRALHARTDDGRAAPHDPMALLGLAREAASVYGPLHSVAAHLQRCAAVALFDCGMLDEAHECVWRLRELARGLRRAGVVATAHSLVAWCDIMLFLTATPSTTVPDSAEPRASLRRRAARPRRPDRPPNAAARPHGAQYLARCARRTKKLLHWAYDDRVLEVDAALSTNASVHMKLLHEFVRSVPRYPPGPYAVDDDGDGDDDPDGADSSFRYVTAPGMASDSYSAQCAAMTLLLMNSTARSISATEAMPRYDACKEVRAKLDPSRTRAYAC